MKLLPAIAVTPTITVLPSAIEERDKLLARARLFQRVTSEASQRTGTEIATLLRRLSGDAEKARVEVKAPVIAAERQIDEAARAYRDPILVEIERIEKSLTAFVREQRAKAAEDERKAREAARAAQEEADRKAKEIQASAQKSAASTPDPVRAQQALDLGTLQARAVVASAAAPVPVKPPPPVPAGLAVRERWTHKLADIPDALWVLANHDRSLVRIEPNLAAIRAKIDAGERNIPGLVIFEDLQARTSAK